ncbi:Allantoicase [Actinomortierella ambigua]|uniref:Allantoicase n=1 Tax=Actinomortierella ambigua TaxID=1343610 RepID=A0A9P6QCD0_9FUNG|nr:Allantoicase [Actinomortierella ambigua]
MGQSVSRAANDDTTYFKIEAAEMSAVEEKYVDLACVAQGGKVLETTDELFGEGFHLIQKGVAIEDKNRETANGFWKDGWETRRHNKADRHSAIIKLAASGRIFAFDIDTSYFDGSHPAFASVEGYFAEDDETDVANFKWTEILPKVELNGNSHHYYGISLDESAYTHLRLNMFPDGGIARFRAYGVVQPTLLTKANGRDAEVEDDDTVVDLACMSAGGRVIRSNDSRYGAPSNILLPIAGVNTRDGWQTKRSREADHHDWVEIKLGNYGLLKQVEVDTTHFRGNHPDFVSVDACCSIYNDIQYDADLQWTRLLRKTPLEADMKNVFDLLQTGEKYSHVRLNIYPDGGISRLRVYGQCRPGTPELKPLLSEGAADADVVELKDAGLAEDEASKEEKDSETVQALEVSEKDAVAVSSKTSDNWKLSAVEKAAVEEEEEKTASAADSATMTTTTTTTTTTLSAATVVIEHAEENGPTALVTEISSVSTLVDDAEPAAAAAAAAVEEKPKKGKGSRGGRAAGSAKAAGNVAVAAAKLTKGGKKAKGRSASVALDGGEDGESEATTPRAKRARE